MAKQKKAKADRLVLKPGDALVFVGVSLSKPWLKKGARLTARCSHPYDFHGRPLVRVEAERGGKVVQFYVAPGSVKAAK